MPLPCCAATGGFMLAVLLGCLLARDACGVMAGWAGRALGKIPTHVRFTLQGPLRGSPPCNAVPRRFSSATAGHQQQRAAQHRCPCPAHKHAQRRGPPHLTAPAAPRQQLLRQRGDRPRQAGTPGGAATPAAYTPV